MNYDDFSIGCSIQDIVELTPLDVINIAKHDHCKLNLGFPDSVYMKELDIIAKKLKALEIIKKKQVDCQLFINLFISKAYNYKEYFGFIIHTKYNKLSQEEFDLLKEVLNTLN